MKYRLTSALTGVIIGMLNNWAAAQTPPSPILEEIIITARKRPEPLQQMPMSVLGLDKTEIAFARINNVDALQGRIPNLQILPHPNAASTLRVFMRGIGNNDEQVLQDPAVAIYLDGIYLPRNQGLSAELPTLERVEVLRGPQGTLYGRNASGGAINFVTRQPNLEAVEFSQRLTLGQRSLFESASAINIPLSRRIAARLSYTTVEQDGFVENAGLGTNRFGDHDRTNWRADLKWLVNDALGVRVTADHASLDDTPAYTGSVPFASHNGQRPHQGVANLYALERNAIEQTGFALFTDWEINPRLRLHTISAHREMEDFQNQNAHSGLLSADPLFVLYAEGDSQQSSHELQLSGENANASADFLVGYFWSREELERQARNVIPAQGIAKLVSGDELVNASQAVFGHVNWAPSGWDQRLTVAAGLRWSEDQRRATLTRGQEILASGKLMISPVVGKGNRDFDNLSANLSLMWAATPDVSLYISAASGYKSGGFNARASSIPVFNRGFDDETLLNIESGLKSEWLDGRLRLNAAVFKTDYEDIQVTVPSDPTNILVSDQLNAGEATIQGIEFESILLLSDRLETTLRYGYLDAEFDHVRAASGADLTKQYQFIHSPEHAINLDLRYSPALPIPGTTVVELNYRWQDNMATNALVAAGPYEIPSYDLLSARLSVNDLPLPAGRLRASVWLQNMLDEEYLSASFPAGVPSGFWGEPSTVGVDIVYDF